MNDPINFKIKSLLLHSFILITALFSTAPFVYAIQDIGFTCKNNFNDTITCTTSNKDITFKNLNGQSSSSVLTASVISIHKLADGTVEKRSPTDYPSNENSSAQDERDGSINKPIELPEVVVTASSINKNEVTPSQDTSNQSTNNEDKANNPVETAKNNYVNNTGSYDSFLEASHKDELAKSAELAKTYEPNIHQAPTLTTPETPSLAAYNQEKNLKESGMSKETYQLFKNQTIASLTSKPENSSENSNVSGGNTNADSIVANGGVNGDVHNKDGKNKNRASSSTTADNQSTKAADGKKTDKNKKSSSVCSISNGIQNCNNTDMMTQTYDATVSGLDIAGEAAVKGVELNNKKKLSDGASLTDIKKAQQQATQAAGGSQIVTGGYGTVMGAALLALGSKHQKVSTAIDKKQHEQEIGNNQQTDEKQKETTRKNASEEQGEVGRAAMIMGYKAMAKGAAQLVNGGFNIANSIKAANGPSNSNGPPKAPSWNWNTPGNSSDVSNNPTLTNSTVDTSPQKAKEEALQEEPPSLGVANSDSPNADSTTEKMAPGDYASGKNAIAGGGGISGGGGAGGGGGGSSEDDGASGGKGGPVESKALGSKSSDMTGAVAAGGKGGSGSKDSGIDLGALLAQFMPKGCEGPDAANNPGCAPKEPGEDIQEYANRKPANETGSFLDKNANIFDRIHQTLQDKNRKGIVGI